MRGSTRALLLTAGCVAWMPCSGVQGDESDEAPQQKYAVVKADGVVKAAAVVKSAAAVKPDAVVKLGTEQQRALGIVVTHLPVVKLPERIEALGLVLDPSALVSEAGELAAAQAALRTSQAEVQRLRALYDGGAGASLRALEAAQAEQAKIGAQSQTAAAQFALHWAPLDALTGAQREREMAALTRGRELLVRADLPGRHGLGVLPRTALLDMDGVQIPGRVLGVMRQSGELQGVGLLIGVERAPPGLGVGARLPMTLLTTEHSGRLVPRAAVFYDERGAYVYEQTTAKPGDPRAAYRVARVNLLYAADEGWLVDGLGELDDVVVSGAGALWSLQEVLGQAVDDDD